MKISPPSRTADASSTGSTRSHPLADRPPTPSPATRSAETVDRATDRSANHTPFVRRGSARAVSRAVSFAPAAFTPNRQVDHDRYCLAGNNHHGCRPGVLRSCHARPVLVVHGLRLVVLESPASAYYYPPLIRHGDHPSANTIRSGRQSERQQSSPQLKIPYNSAGRTQRVQSITSFCIGYAMQKLLIRS